MQTDNLRRAGDRLPQLLHRHRTQNHLPILQSTSKFGIIIGSVDDVVPLAYGCDVLLLTADRPPEVRIWTNRACIAARRPWVDAGYHGPLVQVGMYIPGTGGCWECLRAAVQDRHRALGMNPADAPDRGGAVATAVAAAPAGISGYLAAYQVTALITGVPVATPGQIHAVNLAALDAPFTQTDPQRPDCPACAPLS